MTLTFDLTKEVACCKKKRMTLTFDLTSCQTLLQVVKKWLTLTLKTLLQVDKRWLTLTLTFEKMLQIVQKIDDLDLDLEKVAAS